MNKKDIEVNLLKKLIEMATGKVIGAYLVGAWTVGELKDLIKRIKNDDSLFDKKDPQ